MIKKEGGLHFTKNFIRIDRVELRLERRVIVEREKWSEKIEREGKITAIRVEDCFLRDLGYGKITPENFYFEMGENKKAEYGFCYKNKEKTVKLPYRDADAESVRQYRYYQLFLNKDRDENSPKFEINWNGKKLELSDGEFILSCDYLGPNKTDYYQSHEKSVEKLAEMLFATRNFAGSMIWPSRKKEDRPTVNQARGMFLKDRVDLTLQNLKQYFDSGFQKDQCQNKIMGQAFADAEAWYRRFEDFHHFIDYFYLQDFVVEESGEYKVIYFEKYEDYLQEISGLLEKRKMRMEEAFRKVKWYRLPEQGTCIVVDFEMNPISERGFEENEDFSREIIQIGAIMLNEKGEEIDSYKGYIKPEFSKKMNPAIIKLTGITEYELQNSNTFEKAINEFADWCMAKGKCLVFSWSESDYVQIYNEVKAKKISPQGNLEYILKNWWDLQAEFGIAVKKKHQLSLRKALEIMGELYDGKAHDALADARNTVSLFHLMQNRTEFEKRFAIISSVKKSEDMKKEKAGNTGMFSLGDLFGKDWASE